MGEIKKGDKVETHIGLKEVVALDKQKQKTFTITLKSGKKLICSENHMFPTGEGDLKSISTGLSVGNKLLRKKNV
jgi:intein/homing endonuclease